MSAADSSNRAEAKRWQLIVRRGWQLFAICAGALSPSQPLENFVLHFILEQHELLSRALLLLGPESANANTETETNQEQEQELAAEKSSSSGSIDDLQVGLVRILASVNFGLHVIRRTIDYGIGVGAVAVGGEGADGGGGAGGAGVGDDGPGRGGVDGDRGGEDGGGIDGLPTVAAIGCYDRCCPVELSVSLIDGTPLLLFGGGIFSLPFFVQGSSQG